MQLGMFASYRSLKLAFLFSFGDKQFKAFKSLEADNQMVSGFVASVQGKEIAGQDCCCGEDETFAANERSSCEHLDHCS